MGAVRTGVALALTAGLLALTPAAGAADGLPDPTFGTGGFSILDAPGNGEFVGDLVVTPEGKIVLGGTLDGAGGIVLARLNADGSPDLSFGPGGLRIVPDTDEPLSPRGIGELSIQADGKIVGVGLSRALDKTDAFGFSRFLPSGELDPEFGTGGLEMVDIASGEADGVTVAPDGKILATGVSNEDPRLPVVRLEADGDPDATFNAVPAGVRFLDVPASSGEQGFTIETRPGGSILIGGSSENGALLALADEAGNPVGGFGEGGFAVEDLGTDDDPTGDVYDFEVQADGRILATGDASTPNDGDHLLFVARFTAGGDLDPSFANGGVLRLDPTTGFDGGQAMSILGDGKILVAGFHGAGDTWLLRLTPNGVLDPTFGVGGQTIASAVPGLDGATGLEFQADGRPVVGGIATGAAEEELMAGRFTRDGVAVPISGLKRKARGRCGGRVATLVGGPGADRLRGTKRADVIAGLGGRDRISSLAGNDLVCGGGGNDVIKLGQGKDRAFGEGGADQIRGGAGVDRLLGGAGRDSLFGGGGGDSCNGGGGRDARAPGCEKRKQFP